MLQHFDMDEFLGELEHLVQIDSGSRTPEGTERVAAYFEKRFAGLGWKSQRYDVGDEVGPCVRFWNGSEEAYDVLMLGHMDTVFPKGTAMARPFRVEGDKAYGPGVVDMKASLLFAYYAVRDLQERGRLEGRSVCVLFNSDEEISSVHSKRLIESLAHKSSYAVVMEPARKGGEMVKQRRGVARYTLHATGVAAHAGVNPQDGSSAIEELSNWVLALHKKNDLANGLSVNVGVVSGGSTPNTIAAAATAEVDVRFVKPQQVKDLEEFMEELATRPFTPGGAGVKVSGGVRRPPMNPSEETLALCDEITRLSNGVGVRFDWIATGGGSDASFTAACGVPTVDGMGPVGAHAHTADEYLEINTLLPRLKLVTASIDHIVNCMARKS